MARIQPPRNVKKPQNFDYSAPKPAILAKEGSLRKIKKLNSATKAGVTRAKAPSKVTKAVASKPRTTKARVNKPKVVINQAPTEAVVVFVCGSNEQGCLGFGADKKIDSVYRPRLNTILSAAGVVQIAVGGMHSIALTQDNKLLSWGVNDLGALGRDTVWEGAWVEPNAEKEDSDSDNEASGLNPKESTPMEIDTAMFPAGTIFTQVAAGDNASFALTDGGLLYGWGTFKSTDGASTFSADVKVQKLPTLVPTKEKMTKIAAGSNHAVALTSSGGVLAFGIGEQCQLGRRITDRTKTTGLKLETVGLKKDIINVGAGADHSFAVHQNGDIFSWGLNNYCQTGIAHKDGNDFANILHPTRVPSLAGHGAITHIEGGNHHSIALTSTGECLTWGRLNTYALGLAPQTIPANDMDLDERGQPGILKVATQIPGIHAVHVAAGSDHCIAIARDGRAHSWGFNIRGQAGQGAGDDNEEIEVATVIDNTAVRGRTLLWSGAGGQFSVIAGRK